MSTVSLILDSDGEDIDKDNSWNIYFIKKLGGTIIPFPISIDRSDEIILTCRKKD